MTGEATPAPETTLRQDLSQARSELSSKPAAESTSTGAESKVEGEGEESFSIPPEEMEVVHGNETMSKVHKNLLTDYKKKTTAVAERQRALDAREQELKALDEEGQNARTLWDAVRSDPKGAVRMLAAKYNMTVAEAKQAVAEAKSEAEDELKALFGDDAEAVRPHFDKYVEKKMEQALKPMLAWMDSEVERQGKATIRAEIAGFQAELAESGEGEVTPEVEKEMQKLAEQIDPAPGLTTRQYLKFLWQLATAGATKAQVTKEVVQRINRAVRGKEPAEVPSGGSSPGTAITAGMSLREALRVARSEVKAGR